MVPPTSYTHTDYYTHTHTHTFQANARVFSKDISLFLPLISLISLLSYLSKRVLLLACLLQVSVSPVPFFGPALFISLVNRGLVRGGLVILIHMRCCCHSLLPPSGRLSPSSPDLSLRVRLTCLFRVRLPCLFDFRRKIRKNFFGPFNAQKQVFTY